MNLISSIFKIESNYHISNRLISTSIVLNRKRPLKREIKVYFDENANPDNNVTEIKDRFFRLRSGIYVHAPIPRSVRKGKKPDWLLPDIKSYVMTSKDRSFLLDGMNNEYYRTPKYYPDDPFEPYHTLPGFKTAKKYYP